MSALHRGFSPPTAEPRFVWNQRLPIMETRSHSEASGWTVWLCAVVLPPCVSPHVGTPAALVHLDEVKISEHPPIISQTKLRNHLSEDPSLIIMPASFANETVVNQNLLLCELPTIGEAPVKNFHVGFSRKNLFSDIFITYPQISACPTVESLSQPLMVFLRKLALLVQSNLGAHPGKIKNATSLLETTFESFNFHSDICVRSAGWMRPRVK